MSPKKPMEELACIILAAGQGKRMLSRKPKVLHRIAGKTLLDYCLNLAAKLKARRTVVVGGFGLAKVKAHLDAHWRALDGLCLVEQAKRLGSGHAVRCGLDALRRHRGPVLVLYGDVPLVRPRTLKSMLGLHRRKKAAVTFLSVELADGKSYGRVVRDGNGSVMGIVEARDASETQLAIREVNVGVYCFDASFLRRTSGILSSDNAQGEFYLTDTVALAASRGLPVFGIPCDQQQAQGINDRIDLALAEAHVQWSLAERLMRSGVTLTRPGSVVLEPEVMVGRDTIIGWGVHLLGRTSVGKRCRIDAGAVLINAFLENDVWVKPYSVVKDRYVKAHSEVGPFDPE